MDEKSILKMINQKIEEISQEFDIDIDKNSDEIYVYSEKGAFDSMMLVILIAEIEEELMNSFGIEISLTSDKAMAKDTPYESNLKILNLINELN
ncbi:hypothetical protein N9U28_02500 [Acidimicrobiaceae bacterium]|nr:hypothetical protein [Acidimicrobiaceae bacterium]